MIESDNLRTASLYINNQLLSRGLLRDGQNIDFAAPETDPAGLQVTMGRVMSVVNDLILRRDRDAAQRESLSRSLLSLRADAQRQATEATRRNDKLAETQRKLDGAEATERALRTQLKTTETTVHKLKDEMAKMRVLVAQSRAACATEVRKRDRQIDGLKKAVSDAGRVRGGGKNSNVVAISVTGDSGTEGSGDGVARGGTEEDGYSLRLETNEFLTELARGLSEENSVLLDLMRRTVDSLREMSGLEAALDESARTSKGGDAILPPPQRGAEELAIEMEGIMEHLRTILTNPSFVPIEEVEVREVEIQRLRVGWERMEARWKDAVHMIDGWRKRMASGGTSVNMEELSMGLRLSPVRIRNVVETIENEEFADEETRDVRRELSCVPEEAEDEISQMLPSHTSPDPAESLHLVPAPGYKPEEVGEEEEEEEEGGDSDSSIFQDDLDVEDLDAEEPNILILQESTATSVGSPPLPIPPQLSPLKDSYSSANRGSANSNNGSYRKRQGDFTIVEENIWDLAAAAEEPPLPPPHVTKPQQSPQKSVKSVPDLQEPSRPPTASHDSPLFGSSLESPARSNPSRKLFSKPSLPEPEPVVQSQPRSHPISEPARPITRKKPAAKNPTSDASASLVKQTAKRTTSAPDPKQTPSSKPITRSKSTTTDTRTRSPVKAPGSSSRLPRPNNPGPQQSPLTMATIAAKLAASEREADAARVRAKLKAARAGRRQSIMPAQVPLPDDSAAATAENVADPVKKDAAALDQERAVRKSQNEDLKKDMIIVEELEKEPEAEIVANLKPEKRKRERRTSKVVSRRRSTLSPWELESLIQGNLEVESPAR
ncbi:Afadin and alpha-actinin-binding-domain-containing protein [Pseudomassariella vexata]|uniref:Afadin and alpha-actinin-binding-domain-containing protein n=1 Tax=Pseudomassariella vexata TaxID=1141098 RepID=A0A1Y2DK26_9PEZI|nr:Afadin and alpha-actinin-binding-domain-containing protein [Pseudomassariella vexata]ORY59608.1 Afadin and alpha-actinin-binding-domain-containing protein [Pseudomassariella vexata]